MESMPSRVLTETLQQRAAADLKFRLPRILTLDHIHTLERLWAGCDCAG